MILKETEEVMRWTDVSSPADKNISRQVLSWFV